MSVLRSLRHAYRHAHAHPADLRPGEAAEAGLEVRDQIEALAAHIEARGLWLGLLRHFRRGMTGYLLLGIGVVTTGLLVPWTIDRALSPLEDGASALLPAVLLSLVAAAFTLLRWTSTWQVRRLVYRVDLSVQRLIFRRLQCTDPRWLATRGKSSTTFLLEYPQQLSQAAFVAEFAVYSTLIAAYLVCLLVVYGVIGLGVVLTAAIAVLAGRAPVDRMTATAKEYLTGDHRRAALIDALVPALRTVRRQQLEPVVTAAFASVRDGQKAVLGRRARHNAWVGVLQQTLPQVVVWSALLLGVVFTTGLAAGEGVTLLVLVRMLLSAVDENIATYVNLRMAWEMGRDVAALLSEAPRVTSTPPTASALPPGTVVLAPAGAEPGGGITVSPGERVLVCGPDPGRLSSLLEGIAGAPGEESRWTVAHGGDSALVTRGQPLFDGPIAEVVTVWQRPVDRTRYRASLMRGGLIDDLAGRPGGDGAQLSASTTRLSDGQIVRVSLAQALYAEPDVLLLDDVFAPLDPRGAARIAAAVLDDDPRLGTRFYTTTRPEALGFADRILVVAEDEVILLGTEELAAQGARLRRLVGPALTADLLAARAADNRTPFLAPQRRAEQPSEALRYTFPDRYVPPHPTAFDTPTPPPRTVDLWRDVRGMFSPATILAVVLSIAALVAVEYGLVYRVDRGVTGTGDLGWLSALVVVGAAVAWVRSWLPLRAPIGAIDRVHTALVRTLLSGRLDERSGALTERLSRDFFTLELRVPFQMSGFAAAWVAVLAATVTVLTAGWWTLLPLALIAVLGVRTYRRSRTALSAATHLSAACRGPLLNFARGALGTPGYHTSVPLRRALSARFDDLGAIRAAGMLRRSWVQLRTLLTVELLGLAVFLVALWAVVAARETTTPAAGVIVYAAYTFAQRTAVLVEGMQEMDGTVLAIGRVAELLGAPSLPPRSRLRRDLARNEEDPVQRLPGGEGRVPVGAGPALEAEGLRSRMPDGSPQPEPVTLTAAPGSLTFLTGPSGVGKSTLLRTLAGAHGTASGTVLIGGVPPSALSARARALVRFADADVPLLPVPVRALLQERPGSLALRDRLCAITATPAPPPDRDLWELTLVQRQLMTLARVFADRPSVVFLDEATSALDARAERAAILTVREAAPTTAVIAVVHRTANQDLADQRIALRAAQPAPLG